MEDPFQLLFNHELDFTSFSELHQKSFDSVLLEGMTLPIDPFEHHQHEMQNAQQQQQQQHHYHHYIQNQQQQQQFCISNNNDFNNVLEQPLSPFTAMSFSPKSSNASITMASPEQHAAASPAALPVCATAGVMAITPSPVVMVTDDLTPPLLPLSSSPQQQPSTPPPRAAVKPPTSKKATQKPKGRKRRTTQDLPYAPNMLNLNLAPSKRNTRITHNNNTSNTQKSPTPFRCDFPGCDKTFTRPYNLKSHRRTHTAERPFECNVCSKRFARQHDRNRHTKLHFGIKPYVCHLCNKAFARQDALNRHQRPDSKAAATATSAGKASSFPVSSCASTGHRQRQPRRK